MTVLFVLALIVTALVAFYCGYLRGQIASFTRFSGEVNQTTEELLAAGKRYKRLMEQMIEYPELIPDKQFPSFQ